MICSVSKGSIFYEIAGEGFPIVILHAMGTDHRSMKAWIEPIFERIPGYKRIYVDLPAHGYSQISNDLKSSDDIRQNLLDLIDYILPQQRFSLIGTSYGGYLAQGILHQRPEQVKGICLLSPALHMRNRVQPEKVVLTRDEELLNQLDPNIRAGFETLMIYQDSKHLEYFLREIQPGRLLVNRDFLLSDWREKGYFFHEELFAEIDDVDQPALIITGKQDTICSYKDTFILLDKFHRASFVVMDQAGHMLQIEKRELVQELVSEWLDRVNYEKEG
ncbi:alpha/beta fold hydrolase [Fictibacillus barbaricus]|uniref:Pimeloyl-ACP methyl ester carboxylesterase n=1 Tax=Fictibacillus barbaricus TaxID=182136 RepID=A0ABU1TWD3_9BACL|nr:alpha/beta hydrolase [Fictibacillus barbaricus]MDR7071516.1 pimeloyl-ACP methyl ester carboxylesterase [Fictibacillus barbaricus]